MKLQVTQENLSKALMSVARVASTRGTLPILANVLIKSTNNQLSIAATNLDIAITHYCGAKISEEGSITIPARLAQDFISSLPSGVIDLELENNKLHISMGQYTSTVNGIAADDFPVLPAIENGSELSIAGPALKRALQRLVFAASNDESRPVLTGIYMHISKHKLCMAATDSYRLSALELQKVTDESVSMLVPVSAMQDLLRIINDYDEAVAVVYDEQQVLFRAGDVELVARLIDGNYPDYQKLIPGQFANEAIVKRADLLSITKVASLFARESAGSVKLLIDESKKTMSVQSVASQIGENSASIDGEIIGTGEITLNSRYLLEAINSLHGDQVKVSFNGKLEAVVLTDAEDMTYTHLIMPLKS